MKRLLLLFLLLPLAAVVRGQEIQFTATSKPVVTIGETFNLAFTVNGQGQNFRGPSLNGFTVMTGPNMSSSTSIRSVNGKATSTFSQTYSYFLVPTREGTFDIPAASITVDGKTYQSNNLTIKVVKGTGVQAKSGGSQQSNQTVQSGPNDVFLKAFASNANPLQGEGIVVTYKIYTKVPINQITINKLSSFQGFWSQNLIKENDKFNQYQQTIDGEKYIVADIRKIALFPLKSGKLVIEPLEMECVAQIKKQTRTKTGDPFFDDFFNDSFFNNAYATVEKSLKSNALVINVRPLPTVDKPVDFSGAVGNFTFNTELDKTKIKTNDAINLKITVTGQGNLQLIDKINAVFPPDFETYEPKITSNINTSASGVSGSQTFEYLIIPRKAGKFHINPFPFTYYDLSKKRYVTLKSPAYDIEVEKGAGEATVSTYQGGNKEDIKYIGSDIRHIKEQRFHLSVTGNSFFGSGWFWMLIILPVLLTIGILIFWKKQEVRRGDAVLMKNLKATKVAKKRLRKASEFLKEQKQEPFYEEIERALWGYIGDKFSIPVATLSLNTVSHVLEEKKVSQDIINEFINTLNNTAFARFAPGEKSLIMDNIYQEALEMISKIERELR